MRSGSLDYTKRRRSRKGYEAALERDGRICAYCYDSADSVDHLLPLCAGGTNTLDNLVACCRTCNVAAGSRVFSSFGDKYDWVRERRGLC